MRRAQRSKRTRRPPLARVQQLTAAAAALPFGVPAEAEAALALQREAEAWSARFEAARHDGTTADAAALALERTRRRLRLPPSRRLRPRRADLVLKPAAPLACRRKSANASGSAFIKSSYAPMGRSLPADRSTSTAMARRASSLLEDGAGGWMGLHPS